MAMSKKLSTVTLKMLRRLDFISLFSSLPNVKALSLVGPTLQSTTTAYHRTSPIVETT